MEFGENNDLNNHIKEKNGNSNYIDNNNIVWYSSWDAPLPTITTSNSSIINTALHAGGGGLHHPHHDHHQQLPLYGGDGSHVQLDPHLTCLYLGKRRYFEDNTTTNDVNVNVTPHGEGHVCGGGGGVGFALEGDNKKARACYGGGGGGVAAAGGDKTAPFAVVPRCQVEGCHVALLNAKDYHRRHRVCEMHSKAPKVVVLGLEQRFCQQCSRFHVVSEFDDSKRSCRRRLAGHNERRRKSSHHAVTRNSTQECALSLLSCESDSWLSHGDLSIRCSAALRELIAENRIADMTRQLVYDRDGHHLPHHAVEDIKEIIQPHSHYYLQQHLFP